MLLTLICFTFVFLFMLLQGHATVALGMGTGTHSGCWVEVLAQHLPMPLARIALGARQMTFDGHI
jgi:hypothetical protein